MPAQVRPLHAAIADELRTMILAGHLQGPLPSEAELRRQFGVSRSVVRQALRTLGSEGLVSTVRGKGSFVISPERVHRVAQSLNGLGMQIERLGGHTRTEVLNYEVIDWPAAPPQWQEPRALHLVRLRYGYGYPIAHIETFLPAKIAKLMSLADISQGYLHELLHGLGFALTRSSRQVLAVPAQENIAAHLRTPIGAPLLLLNGTTFDDADFPVEVFSTHHRGDRMAFDLETLLE